MGVSDCSLAQGTDQNPIKKNLVRGILDTPITYTWHDRTLSWHGTDTSMESAEVKLALGEWVIVV
jgi:hypothetical protein